MLHDGKYFLHSLHFICNALKGYAIHAIVTHIAWTTHIVKWDLIKYDTFRVVDSIEMVNFLLFVIPYNGFCSFV